MRTLDLGVVKQQQKINPLHSPSFYMEPKNDSFQSRNLLFQAAIFRFHVKLWEGLPLPYTDSFRFPGCLS